MAVTLNHTIAISRDAKASCEFVSEILGLPTTVIFGMQYRLLAANNVCLDFLSPGQGAAPAELKIARQHYAFLVSETEFDAIFQRLRERNVRIWGDPFQKVEGHINRFDGGRGVYFEDPTGHYFEVFTRPYGSGGATVEDVKAFLREHGQAV